MIKTPYFLFAFIIIVQVKLYSYEIEFQFDVDEKGNVLPSALFKSAEEAYELNMKGLDALELDNYDEALEYFEKASESIPNYSDAINNIGVVYFRRGNVVMAQETWQKVVQIDPGYATSYYNLGIVRYSDKRYKAAKEYFLQALDKNKRFVDALVMLGRVELVLGNKKTALNYLKKAYKINPMHQGAWGTLAYGHIQNGDTATAEKILGKYKKNAYALKMLGQIEASRGHMKNAIRYLSEAVARGGEKSILLEISQIQLDSGQCAAALKTMQSYFRRVSHPAADAWLLAGIAAKECGDISETKRYFEQGVKYYPNDQLLRFNLGQVYFYQRDYSNADKVWAALADTINDPALFHLKAVAARKQNKLAEAEDYICKALLMDTKAEYYDFLGVILHERGKKDEAIIQFKKALALNPSLRSAQLNLAISERTEKSIAEANTNMERQLATCQSGCSELSLQLSILYYHGRQYEKAIKILGDIPDKDKDLKIYRHLAIYYRAVGELDKAITVLEKAQKRLVIDPQTENELAETYLQAGLYAKAIMVLNDLTPKWDKNPWRLYYQLGYAYVKQNDLRNAERYLEKSLKKKKNNVAARGLLALIYNERGETKKAQNLWKKTLRDDPSNPALWINIGLLLEKEGKYQKAIEKYQHALSLPKGDNSILINIGNVYEQMSKPRKALQTYEKALDSDKRDVAAYNVFNAAKSIDEKRKAEKMLTLLQKEFSTSIYTKRASAEMLLWQGDTTTALKIFETLPQKNAYDWCALANIYVAQGKGMLAEAAIKNLPETPQWNRARKSLQAKRAYAGGQYQEAFALLKEQNDTSYDGQYNTAFAAFNAEEYETAMQIGRELVRHATGQDKEELYRLVGTSAMKLKDWEVAQSWFSQLVGIKPDDAVAYYNMAVAACNLDNMDASWKWYQKAREIDSTLHSSNIENKYKALNAEPEDTTVLGELDKLYNQAVELQQQGSDTAAEEIYKEIVEKDGRFYRAWNNLGAIYGVRGEIDEAIDCYKNAVSRRADIADGYANLVNIYIALEDFRKAERWLAKGKKRNPDSEVLKQMEQALADAKEKVNKE